MSLAIAISGLATVPEFLLRRQHRTDRLGAVHLHGSEFLALLALPASLMLAVSAPEIVAVVLGAQRDAAVPVLQVLAGGAARVDDPAAATTGARPVADV